MQRNSTVLACVCGLFVEAMYCITYVAFYNNLMACFELLALSFVYSTLFQVLSGSYFFKTLTIFSVSLPKSFW